MIVSVYDPNLILISKHISIKIVHFDTSSEILFDNCSRVDHVNVKRLAVSDGECLLLFDFSIVWRFEMLCGFTVLWSISLVRGGFCVRLCVYALE